MDDLDDIRLTVQKAAEQLGVEVLKDFAFEMPDEIMASVYGDRFHICAHCYPEMNFAAIDVYLFDIDLDPSKAMQVFRKQFHPQKLRATSVKRGNIQKKDMKPQSHNKTTTLRKFKKTGSKMVSVARFIRHKRQDGDLGPE